MLATWGNVGKRGQCWRIGWEFGECGVLGKAD